MASASSYDVIVIGVGAMGAATCHALAGRGVRVLGLERFDVPHALGSSGGHTRLVRLVYYEHPDYVPLLRRAYAGWDAFGEELGEPLLQRTGALYLGRPRRRIHRRLAARRTPHTAWPTRSSTPRASASGAARSASPSASPRSTNPTPASSGASGRSPDSSAAPCGSAPRCTAGSRCRPGPPTPTASASSPTAATYEAGHLVITAGAWTGRLVRDLGVELTVTRQVVGWVWPKTPERFALGRFPCWAIEDDAPGFAGIYYGFPMTAEVPGLKVAHHAPGPTADPDALDRTPTAADEADFRPALRKYLPDADGPLLSMRVCMYTMSPDQHFVVDRHPEHPRVTVACGFSGHGFKFAPALGAALADLATEGATELPVAFLGRARFERGG